MTELDELNLNVPDEVFDWLFEPYITGNDKKKGFLEIFNFTIDESLPLDIEVAVDPEMLGKVYESLIAEEERGNIGIFYTPRIEIDFMCRMSLIEYLATETKIDKEKITDFIYEPQNKINNLSKDELSEIKNKLDNLKIVDPAVGSASFLVGMMNILVELHTLLTKQIEGKEENLFALKQKIIQENLYGVDVKDWAVMVAELRLWLSLIIETEEKYMDIYTKPLLPNLSFKIRQGDSLVEEIGGVQISLRGETFKYLPNRLKSKIKELIDRKNAFFSGQRSANLKEIKDIEKFEQDIFIEIIDSKIKDLTKEIENWNKRIKDLNGAKDVFNEEDLKAKLEIEERTNQIEDLKKEKEKYEELINKLKNKTQKDYFLWEVDFAEVFAQKGGFDIVIGNPPYVRQEIIAPPLENKDNYNDEEWRKIKAEYKEKLISSVKNIWKGVEKIDKKSDLYVYFYYHGLSLLKDDGIFCFINSNSWLDVGYGAGLQEFLLK
ncbi:MAG: BREX-1 system adenine-specific DNA-methyltransferase PglX, partial [bacterium]|nr:BREX-1 system adenine-specific DNA-methyltransferase PglX [bacterium]MDW8164083.1 Eco57I restriction-modification methylase domain-containing protein [Candidatus Omnitrophota bacterium]